MSFAGSTASLPFFDREEGRSLRSGFLRSSEGHPDAVALIVEGQTRSYRQLEHTARVWAAVIVNRLGRAAERVGVFAYRSEVSYTGVLAALFSGAAFVPLNRTFPPDRTGRMVLLASLDAIIVDQASSTQLLEILNGLESIPLLVLAESIDAPAELLDRLPPDARVITARDIGEARPLENLPPVLPDETAYLLFTSGSTGVPKGVPVSHGNVLAFIDAMVIRYGIGPEDRFSQTFDQTFDLSVFDLFVAWERGACVCAMQPLDLLAPSRFVARERVTIWFSVPSIPALMRKKNILKPGIFPTLRWSLFCGEPLPVASAEAWAAAAPNSTIENLYGPTELTIACMLHRWDPARSPLLSLNGVVPIGRPYPGLGSLVVDENLQPLEAGAGELCICGAQTVSGYWQAPEKTTERFVLLPISDSVSLRFYRTGDRVLRLPDGDYVYLGRVDHQVKVLGHRVELGEIEAVLREIPEVVEAVAFGWPEEEGTSLGISAFVSGKDIDKQVLLEHARAKLPDYMTPREIHVVNSMPLNANGKVDRKALRSRLEQGSPARGPLA